MICRFIAEHKARFGVAPICRALSAQGCMIASRTYWAWASRPLSRRALWDLTITEVIAGLHERDELGRKRPESLYGSVKMWAYLNRQGIEVARCTVERLMRANGWRGVTRAKRVRTTISDPAAVRAPDLVERHFRADEPDVLFVADFTYVPMATGVFAYTAFIIDAFAGTIVGWECSTSKVIAFVERAIRQAVRKRRREGNPLQGSTIHHSDAGSQYTSVHFAESLALEGILPSIGSVGDAFDNALAETTIGLYKTECTRAGSPFRTGPFDRLSDVEQATSSWVHWYNTERLMHRLGRRPPAEFEADYYAHLRDGQPAVHT